LEQLDDEKAGKVEQKTRAPATNKKKNMQDELVNEESEEFPEEMPKVFGFGAFAK